MLSEKKENNANSENNNFGLIVKILPYQNKSKLALFESSL